MYVLLFPLLTATVSALSTSHQPTLMNDRSVEGDSLDLLSLIKTYIPRYLHGVTDECVAARVVHRSLDNSIVLYHVDGQTGGAMNVAELVIDRLGLDCVERDESCLASALVAHVLHTID